MKKSGLRVKSRSTAARSSFLQKKQLAPAWVASSPDSHQRSMTKTPMLRRFPPRIVSQHNAVPYVVPFNASRLQRQEVPLQPERAVRQSSEQDQNGPSALSDAELQEFGVGGEFIVNVEAWIGERIQYQIQQIDNRRRLYQERNWRWDESAVADQKARIRELKSLRSGFRTALRAGITHGINLLNLGNVTYNEAGSSGDLAKRAVAYAWLNRTGGTMRVPRGQEISHFRSLRDRWPGLDVSGRLTFLAQFIPSLQAARTRLIDQAPERTDPTNGATHWVSPIGLPTYNQQRHGNSRYRRTVGSASDRAFPLWARHHDTPEAATMQREGQLASDFEEIVVEGVSQEEFLFYRGVN